jgi:predicted AAA+ superfamily ATPase
MFQRLCKPSKSNSFFLFGARGTGKTTLLTSLPFLDHAYKIDLLVPDEEMRYGMDAALLWAESARFKKGDWIVIDEVQKLPKLLDLVQKIIEEKKINFALTGSSARKLKRGGANLLAGRAFVYHLFPLLSREIGQKFNLDKALTWGTLPKILQFDDDRDRAKFLNAYVNIYIKEEIQVEQLVRNLDPFRLFLPVAAQMNGEIINYTNIARDTGVDTKTIQNYFQILEDTHLGFFLLPYTRSVRKVQKKSPKFYFLDTGVKRALERKATLPLAKSSSEYGNAFETWFINECMRESSYLGNDFRFSYLRTKDDVEIDLVIERPGRSEMLVEIKSTEKIDARHLRSLVHFRQDFPEAEFLCVSQDPKARTQDGIMILPWQEALKSIFQ